MALRTLRTYVGAENTHGVAGGVSEVQEPVLEQAQTQAKELIWGSAGSGRARLDGARRAGSGTAGPGKGSL